MTSRAGTLRICVLGNSHVACLRETWRDLAAGNPRIEIRFFATRGSRIAALQLKADIGRLVLNDFLLQALAKVTAAAA